MDAKLRHRILVVDDEPANLELLTRILRRHYDVTAAASGPEALELLRKENFAAIISDQRMPGMNGTEFLSQARNLVPDTVRMILTGYTAEQDSLDAINVARVSTFLTKPIVIDVFERAVSDAVQVFEMSLLNRSLVEEMSHKNAELEEAKRLLELSLDGRTRELLEANHRLESLALRDSLTGLYNHRFLQERLAEEIARTKRYGSTVCLVLCDLDRFRVYNEANGHPEGDKLLVAIAKLLSGTSRSADVVARLRPTDMVARFGGEEFALIVPATPKIGASTMCERIRATMANARFPGAEVLPGQRVTMSFGVAESPGDAESKDKLLEAAETALLRAKQGGRDRIELY